MSGQVPLLRICFLCCQTNKIQAYIDALLTEIQQNLTNSPELKSIYIGGGTPSLLEIKHFRQILDKISGLSTISDNTEITAEINPNTVDFKYLKELKSLGINRLSIGVQSLTMRY
ncbi:MAG: hypothetical protein MZV64_64910 [Ignavibacteriales bacterium]|nr:hypothetical protein [Ignavibacteriales bacterium]